MIVTGQQGEANEINEHSSMKTPTKTQLLILVSGRLRYLQEVGTILSPHLNHDVVLDKSIGFFILLYPTVHILLTKYEHSFIHSKYVSISHIIFLGCF